MSHASKNVANSNQKAKISIRKQLFSGPTQEEAIGVETSTMKTAVFKISKLITKVNKIRILTI